jgi:hypothetical protein
MKNIYVIPTDKPSRLWINTINGELVLDKEANELHAQNIYITSDEKLPYDSSIFNSGAFYHRDPVGDVHIITKHTFKPNPHFCKRIILTTDQDLIKDDVQAIDDEFLEWFVKNLSCESVSVNKQYITPLGDVVDFCYDNERLNYKIIIPKEEPKQDTVGKEFYESADKVITVKRQEKKPHSFCETPEEQCTMNYCDENGCQNRVRHLVEPKQEQDKNKYSEEEVLDLIYKRDLYLLNRDEEIELELPEEWFEQFKKK